MVRTGRTCDLMGLYPRLRTLLDAKNTSIDLTRKKKKEEMQRTPRIPFSSCSRLAQQKLGTGETH